MKTDSDTNNYSADYFIEDYQRQLKKKQDHGFHYGNAISSDVSPTDLDNADASSPDLSVSMSHVENQLISQFREYKEIKTKLDDAKRQLHLSSQIQVSVDNLKELERAHSQRKQSLDDMYRDTKKQYDDELTRMKRDVDRMVSEKSHVIQLVKRDQLKAKYDVQVSFEQEQLVQSESFYFDFCKQLNCFLQLEDDAKQHYDDFILELEEKKVLTKKRFDFDCEQLTVEFNGKRDELDTRLADKKQTVLTSIDLMNKSFQDQVDTAQRVLDEQHQCLRFEFESIHGVFHMLVTSCQTELETKKKQSVDTLLEFSEQLNQKKDMWELEKVKVREHIDTEQFQWEEERKRIVYDLDHKKQLVADDIEALRKQFLTEKESWTVEQETVIHDYEQKKALLVRDVDVSESRLRDCDIKLIKQAEILESYDLLMYEREQVFECVRQHMLCDMDKKRHVKLDGLELEYLDKKNKFSNQLKQLEDRQKLDFSQRLELFEKDLSQRRRLFEDDLLNRRQKIVEECKRDQKIEFDHLLDFQKDNHLKQQKVLLDQVNSLKEDLDQKDSLYNDQFQEYQDQIKDFQNENTRLTSELSTIEDLTRKKTIGSYEDKYKQSMDLYKQQSQKEIQSLKLVNVKLDSDLKKKELELRDFQLKVKRLESQLNKFLIVNNDSNSVQSFQGKQKVVRSNNFKRGL
ncbi:hypothetical protein DID74_01815 [Candidatus Marinamargulisbacteria bacterium SCGC AG-333-B06]|nr:hypothetical protein DID74_01815 [Candidatus Marinamargulisbacteria bacterium SCGC AG-333-B06]